LPLFCLPLSLDFPSPYIKTCWCSSRSWFVVSILPSFVALR
jgi:hypothetical protein